MLELAAQRLGAPTEHAWRDLEQDRLGHAIALTPTRPELTEADAIAWLVPVTELVSTALPSPVPATVSNARGTLHVVYFLTARGVHTVPHRKVVEDRLAAALVPQR